MTELTFPLCAQLPLGLLTAAQGHPMLVELKNGETLNGHLVTCDTWMNLTLKEVVQTSPVRCARSVPFLCCRCAEASQSKKRVRTYERIPANTWIIRKEISSSGYQRCT
jgi:small nuclear ribonucleoprotein (snRNP)-like protein